MITAEPRLREPMFREAQCMSDRWQIMPRDPMQEGTKTFLIMKDKSILVHNIVDTDAVHATESVGDKNLERNNDEIKQLVNEREIDWVLVLWCSVKKQADCMTKRGAAAWGLMQVFRTGVRYEV